MQLYSATPLYQGGKCAFDIMCNFSADLVFLSVCNKLEEFVVNLWLENIV